MEAELTASYEERPLVENATSKDESVVMEKPAEAQAEESCCPAIGHPEPPTSPEAAVKGEKLEPGKEEVSVMESEGAPQTVNETAGSPSGSEGQLESTSTERDPVCQEGTGVEEPESKEQQLWGVEQDARNEEKRSSVHERLGPRGAESSDWRRGKRGRPGSEQDEHSERSEWCDRRNNLNGDAGRKRRKSGDSKAALPLSPEEKCFRMGAVEGSRGSPKSGRNKRRERYQPPRSVKEEDQRATLYVGDIEQLTNKRDLRGAFQRFGEIKEAKMITNQCYGFVTFRLRADAESALQSAGSIEILGRKPYVSWAQGAMPAWKIGVGGFVLDPSVGIVDKRDALSKAAEVAAGVAAAAVRAKQKLFEESVQTGAGGRSLVAYDDLF